MSRELPSYVQQKIDAALRNERAECNPIMHRAIRVNRDPGRDRRPLIIEPALPTARGRIAKPHYRSQLEADYAALLDAQRLAGEIHAWLHEGMTLNLGGGAKYKPDFNIVGKDGELTMAETKGFRREAAIVRIKVAAAKFPWLRFILVQREDGAWKSIEVKSL